jgi:hypothetical protein
MEWIWNESCLKFVEWNGMIGNCYGMEWKWNENFQDFGSLVDNDISLSQSVGQLTNCFH